MKWSLAAISSHGVSLPHGIGEVFAALDESTCKSVALERLLPGALRQRAIVVHFMREYHALSELSHPRIIEVYDHGVDREVPYYTMELLDGQDLRDLSPLPVRKACRYIHDVASSLALLLARSLLHRDVSPRNVRCHERRSLQAARFRRDDGIRRATERDR